jgi:hypothetical protein
MTRQNIFPEQLNLKKYPLLINSVFRQRKWIAQCSSSTMPVIAGMQAVPVKTIK